MKKSILRSYGMLEITSYTTLRYFLKKKSIVDLMAAAFSKEI